MASETTAEPLPMALWEDERTQVVYRLLCSDEVPPNTEEHWEGWIARRIIAALIPSVDGTLRRSAVPLPELLRVDVGGVSVFVRGQVAYDYLVHVNHKLAVANKALHAIAAAEDEMDRVAIAAKALEDMKGG